MQWLNRLLGRRDATRAETVWFLLTLRPKPGSPDGDDLPQAWGLPAALAAGLTARGQAPLAPDGLRYFPRLGVAAVNLPETWGPGLRDLPGVAAVATGHTAGRRPYLPWYLNLIAAWEHILACAEDCEGAVVNLSLGPPAGEPSLFDPDEPLNRATRRASEHGIVTVISAGNEGRGGEDTMTRWAKAPWMVSAGAADAAGARVEPYSSRGLPGSDTRPTVVAPGMQQPPTGDEGTSFAAPCVADIVLNLQAFLLTLWKLGGRPPEALKSSLPRLARRGLELMAQPIAGAEHERGAGFVSRERVTGFLKALTIAQARSWLGSVEDPWLDETILAQAQSRFGDAHELPGAHRLLRFTIDFDYEWTLPTFVPGLLRMRGFFLLRVGDRFERLGDFERSVHDFGASRFIQISILPEASLGRDITVSQDGTGQCRSISAALEQAGEHDVIVIRPGVYREQVQLKTGVILVGETGAVIDSPSDIPVVGTHVQKAALLNLEVVARGPRRVAVSLVQARNVSFSRCTLRSLGGNAVQTLGATRCLFTDCTLEGSLNGVFAAYSSEQGYVNSTVSGAQTGVLFYAASGEFARSRVTGSTGDAVIFIPSTSPWTTGGEALVFTYPVGVATIRRADVGVDAIGHDGPEGFLSRLLYGLRFTDTTLEGGRVALAALDFRAVAPTGFTAKGGQAQFGIIQSVAPLPVEIPGGTDVATALGIVHDSIRQLSYRLFDRPEGARPDDAGA